MKQLILNADDFGLTRGVNEAIIQAHREGVLTSATLMANGAAFDDAVERARANPTLGVGCHLVLVGGVAVSPRSEIPSLADDRGHLPATLGALVRGVTLGSIPRQEIECELGAQVQKIRSAGIEPTHFDTHKHAHAHPRVFEALGCVAREFGIQRVRKPLEALSDSWATTRSNGNGSLKQLLGAMAVRTTSPRFRAIAQRYSLRFPDRFVGLAATGYVDSTLLRGIIDTLTDGCTEIMLHPGKFDADLAGTGSRLQGHRERELDALLDPAVKRAISETGVRLISYRELN